MSRLLGAGIDRHRVEKRLGSWRKAELAQAGGQRGRAAMHLAGDMGQALRAVIDRIHRGDHRQQHLRGADVGGRLFAADVLFAGLQREAIGRLAPRIDRQRRQCVRAASASARRAPPYRPRAVRHIPSARRNAAPIRSRYRRRVRRASVSSVSASEIGGDDRERALGVRRRDRRRAGRAPRRRCPDIAAARRTPRHVRDRSSGSPTITFHPSGSARVRSTASVCGCTSRSTKNDLVFAFAARSASAIASAAAVASSSSEALATSGR